MKPLMVRARLAGPIALPTGHLSLDGVLAWAVATRDNLPPPVSADDCEPVEIPLQREPGGRFHLCSIGQYKVEAHEHRFVNRRFPLTEAQEMGNAKLRRIAISAGPCKSYRIPLDTLWLENDEVKWWAIGDRDGVLELLDLVSYLGKKRGVGVGRVKSWEAVECAQPWEGFPVVRDGLPLRSLPPDWPGLNDAQTAYATMTYPYWDHAAEQLCAVPR